MQHPWLDVDDEVIDHVACLGQRLRPDTRRSRQQISLGQVRNISLQALEETGFAQIPFHFTEPGAPVAARESAKPAASDDPSQIPDVHTAELIPGPRERQNCVGTKPNVSIHARWEMAARE